MKPLPAPLLLLAAALLSGCASPAPVLRSGSTTVEIAPEHAARVMSFRPDGLGNLLWDNPAEDKNLWKWMNYGGEKTWIGPQSLWKETPEGSWPPPLFCDQAAFSVIERTPTSWTLRSPFDAFWHLAVERTITLTNDVLTIAARVLEDPDAPCPFPLADLRVWSVTQVPYTPRLTAHLVGEGRFENDPDTEGRLPEPVREPGTDLLRFDLSSSTDQGKVLIDADSLSVEIPDGALVLRHQTSATDLGPKPGRCHLFSGQHPTISPEQGARYLELEFLAPATETHAVSIQFLPAR